MNKERIRRYDCYTDNGKISEVFQALDCFEQVKYWAVYPHNENLVNIFVNDVNPVYYVGKDNGERMLSKNEQGINFELFEVVDYSNQVHGNYHDIITELLSRGNMVAFETYFDLVYPYCWYNENSEGVHRKHYSTIIDDDKEYYYFVDSPFVLEPCRNTICDENRSVNKLKKEELNKAFDKLCILKTVSFIPEKKAAIITPNRLIETILHTYFDSEITETDSFICYEGKKAWEHFCYDLFNDNYHNVYETTLNSHWEFHLLMSRHLLLLRYFEQIGIDGGTTELLENCITMLEHLKSLCFKNSIKATKNFRKKIIAETVRTMNCEDLFMKKLQEMYKIL